MELEEEPDNFSKDEREELERWKADWIESQMFAF